MGNETQVRRQQSQKMIRGRKFCEPDAPAAAAESFAKPTAGGSARKTVYTFFYICLSSHVRAGEVRVVSK